MWQIDCAGAKLVTDEGGQAVFNLRPGVWPVKVTKRGYVPASLTIVVDKEAVTQEVTLVKQ